MRVSGPLSHEQAIEYLARTVVPARIASRDAEGWPVIASLWFVVEDGVLCFATPSSAAIVRWLRDDPRCSVEVAPETLPYSGVRVRGRASVRPDPERAVLRKAIDRYLGTQDSDFARWLLTRPVDEVAIRVEPLRMTSWDFARRMASALD